MFLRVILCRADDFPFFRLRQTARNEVTSSSVPNGQTHPQKLRPKTKEKASNTSGAPITITSQSLCITCPTNNKGSHNNSQDEKVGAVSNVKCL
jgi:hypothetical protein